MIPLKACLRLAARAHVETSASAQQQFANSFCSNRFAVAMASIEQSNEFDNNSLDCDCASKAKPEDKNVFAHDSRACGGVERVGSRR